MTVPLNANAIFFDWNGTLLADTLCNIRATNSVLKRLGKPVVTKTHYLEQFNVPLEKMYRAFGCSAQELIDHFDLVHDVWIRVYDSQSKKARLRRGARTMLQTLQKRQDRAFILSNHTIENISGHTKRLGIHNYFTAILANDGHGPAFTSRNKGDRLYNYLKKQKINKAIIVGDTEEEIDIAKEHGLVSVAITDGVCSAKRLKTLEPDFLINSLTEIPAIMQRVFGARQETA